MVIDVGSISRASVTRAKKRSWMDNYDTNYRLDVPYATDNYYGFNNDNFQ